jgi:hypothetical protein
LPADPGLDRLLADPAVGSTAKAVAVALVRRWAWRKDHCWPCDASIAAAVGRSVGHIQRALRQLERAGYLDRERTHEVPNGRRIWLLWRVDEGATARRNPEVITVAGIADEGIGAGAQPAPAPARNEPPAPARSEPVVIVNPLIEPVPGQEPRRLREEPVAPPAPAPEPRRRGLDVTELAEVVARTGDPILAAELVRRTAPPPAPEPPAASLATPELLGRLPGRHDLVVPAAGRLCLATGDHGAVTFKAFEKMARAVASRAASAGVLASCLAQATGPAARHRGKVLVAAWRREGPG